MRPALTPPATSAPPPLTPAHHALLRLLAELMAEDYVAELREAEDRTRDNDQHEPLA